jgi:DNA polymerase I-like protein with 3'-5' exonuclease and polymerase domains
VIEVLHVLECDGGPLAVDIETYRRQWISCVGLAWSAHSALCIPFFSFGEDGAHRAYWDAENEILIWSRLKRILEDPRTQIIGQNFAYDTQFFYRFYDIDALCSFDTMVAHHLLYPGTPKGLDDLASLYCDHYCFWKKESQDWDIRAHGAEAHWAYNAKDCCYTFEVAEALRDILKQEGLVELFEFQMDQTRLAREMTIRGVNYDRHYVSGLSRALRADASDVSAWLLSAVPESLQFAKSGIPWHDSVQAMSDLFHNRLGFKVKAHKKTGRPTLDDSALQEFEETHPWISPITRRIRHLRSVKVFTSHFIDARPSADGRLHCQFNPAHPETFRWSSSATGFGEGTNLQNVPKPTED